MHKESSLVTTIKIMMRFLSASNSYRSEYRMKTRLLSGLFLLLNALPVLASPFVGLPIDEAVESIPDAQGYWQREELVQVPVGRSSEAHPLRVITVMQESSPGRSEEITTWIEKADQVIVSLRRGVSSAALEVLLENYSEKTNVVPDPGLGETNYLVFLSNPNLNSVPALVSYLEGYPEAVEYAESYAGVIMEEPFSSAESRPIAENGPKSGDMIPRAGEEDPLLAESPYFDTHNIPEVWKMSTGEGVVVAVIDTGVDMDHKDLVDNIWINEDEIPENGKDDDANGYVDDRWGWDFGSILHINGDRFPEYSHQAGVKLVGHGAEMTGIVAATRNEHMTRGIAYGAEAMTIRSTSVFFNSSVNYSRNVARSIHYAVDNGADIINASIATRRSRALRKAVEHAQKKGVLIVAGAGNNGKEISPGALTFFYPALYSEDYDNVLSVGEVNNDGKRAGYSNFSKTHVNMGVFEWEGHQLWIENFTIFFGVGGTSTAAPVVSSTAALIKSLQPSWNGQKIRKHLEEHVIVYPGLANTFKTSGVLDIFGAVEAAHPGHLSFVEPEFQQFNEDDNSGVIPQVVYVFERQGGTKGTVSVSPEIYHIDTSPKDFVNDQLPTLTWLDGESGKKSVILKIADDNLPEDAENFALQVSWEGFASADKEFPIVGINQIIDEDYAAHQVGFSGPSYVAEESAGVVNIPVERIDGGKRLRLFYDFHSLVDADNADFNVLIMKPLAWKDGEKGVRSIPIPVKDDMKMEKTEAIRIVLKQDFPKKPTNLIDPQRREFILLIKDNDEGNLKMAD